VLSFNCRPSSLVTLLFRNVRSGLQFALTFPKRSLSRTSAAGDRAISTVLRIRLWRRRGDGLSWK